MAREIADFSYKSNKKFIWSFPYLRQVLILNYVFFSSFFSTLKKAWKEDEPLSSVIFSEYFVMNVFVLLTTTIEYIVKSIASLFLSCLFFLSSRDGKSILQKKVFSILKVYSIGIRKKPWFEHDFATDIESLVRCYTYLKNSRNGASWTDYFTYKFILLDWKFKKMLAPIIKAGFPDPDESIIGYNTNYFTTIEGSRREAPTYDSFTDYVMDTYKYNKNKDIDYKNKMYIKNLWGQKSTMCRMQISKTDVKDIKNDFNGYIQQIYEMELMTK